MKKSEINQITQLIELIVAKEVRKQLPTIIAETFKNMMGNKSIVTEKKIASVTCSEPVQITEDVQSENVDFKSSLRELFAGTPVMQPQTKPKQQRQFTKDPILNQILNETTPDLRAREGLAGMAVASDAPGMMLETSSEPSFMRNVPTMGGPSQMSQIPIGNPPILAEGQTSTHAPLSALPDGISALDVAKHGAAPAAVTGALTRNYSNMMKLIDKKRGKV